MGPGCWPAGRDRRRACRLIIASDILDQSRARDGEHIRGPTAQPRPMGSGVDI